MDQAAGGDLWAIEAGRLIDGSGRPAADGPVTVLIAGDRIQDVRPGHVALPHGAIRLAYPTGTLLPGLVDCHLHCADLLAGRMFEALDAEASIDAFMAQLVRHGITSVRDTGSGDLDVTFPILKRGRPRWPRFSGAGLTIDGLPGAHWDGIRPVGTAEEARVWVRALAAAGVDFVKIYVWLGKGLARATVHEAARHGLRVAGHVGHVMTVADALTAGVAAFEHVRVGRELIGPADRPVFEALRQRENDEIASFAAWRFIDPEGPAARELIGRMVDADVTLTPTLSFSESILRAQTTRRTAEPGAWEAAPGVQAGWQAMTYTSDYSPLDWQWAPVEMERQLTFVGLAHAAGLRVTAGTDTPNPHVPPGSSMHGELALLAEAGLSPLAAIAAATSKAAVLLGRRAELGTVERGKLADLVVVEGDPSHDLGALREVRLVVKDGDVIFDDRVPRA